MNNESVNLERKTFQFHDLQILMAYNGFLAFLHGEKNVSFQMRKKTKGIGNMREKIIQET